MNGLQNARPSRVGLVVCRVDFSRPGRLKSTLQNSNSGCRSPLRLAIIGVSLAALSACSALGPARTPATTFYALNSAVVPSPSPAQAAAAPPRLASSAPTLLINPPHAAAGFDSPRIIYLRQAHKLDYFALSQWVEPLARLLGPLLVSAIEKTGAFRAVVLMPGAASGALRLLQQAPPMLCQPLLDLEFQRSIGPGLRRDALRGVEVLLVHGLHLVGKFAP